MGRAILVILVAAIASELAWVVGMNLFLNSRLLATMINRKPEKMRIEWESARTWWPGDLRVKGFAIRANQLDVQWVVELDEARAQVGLLALLEKRFLTENLVAHGGSFRLRNHPKTEFQLAKEPVIAPIPWVEYEMLPPGFEPAVIAKTERRPPRKALWAADLRGVKATGFREIWINEYRYQGDATGTGDFFIRAKEYLDLSAANVELHEGTVTLGEQEVLEVRKGALSFAIPDVSLVEYRGREVLAFMDAKATLESGVDNIRFVDFYLGRFPGLELRSGPGALWVNVAMVDGIAAGSIDLAGRGVVAEYEGTRFRGDLRIDGRIAGWRLGTDGALDLSGTRGRVENVVIADENDDKVRVRGGDGWFGEATLERAKLTLGEAFRLDAKIAAKIRDTGPLVAVFETRRNLPDKIEKALHVKDLKGGAEIIAGGGKADVRRVEVKGDDFELRARMKLREGDGDKGILYVKRGKLSFGLEKGGKRNVKVAHPRRWFDAHPLNGGAPVPSSPATSGD